MATSTRTRTEWWTNSDNVLTLANRLVDAGIIDSCKELLCFFSKPWKCDLEWKYLQRHGTMEGFDGKA